MSRGINFIGLPATRAVILGILRPPHAIWIARAGRNNRRALRRMLVQFSCDISIRTARPVARVNAHLHQPAKRRVWSVGHLCDIPVFNGIGVPVVHMGREIGFFPDQVLPIAALPNATLSTSAPNRGSSFRSRKPFREPGLDELPAQREIRISRRKFKHAMHVVRQHNPSENCERMSTAHLAKYLAQRIDMRK